MDTINCWNKPPSLTQGRYACSGLSATHVFINGHIADQIKAHFPCKLRSSCILTQTAHELVHIGFVLLVSLFTLQEQFILRRERFLFGAILFKQIDTNIFGNTTEDFILIDTLNQLVKLRYPESACQARQVFS